MKITSLKHLHFQRNGVSGEPFYSCIVSTSDSKKYFAVSFRADSSDRKVITSSCRAICLSSPATSWRGDHFAYALQDYFDQIGGEIYELTKKEVYAI